MARLKRVILIGDHHQLPPVVKNMAFQKYSHLDQSLFTRFVRLGTPYTQLNAQARHCPATFSFPKCSFTRMGVTNRHDGLLNRLLLSRVQFVNEACSDADA